MQAIIGLAALLALAACVTSPGPLPGVRSWHGPEQEVVEAIVTNANPPEIVTIRYANGAYVVVGFLEINEASATDGYCYQIYAERNPRRDGARWRTFENERYCMVYRDLISAWEGDARDWR